MEREDEEVCQVQVDELRNWLTKRIPVDDTLFMDSSWDVAELVFKRSLVNLLMLLPSAHWAAPKSICPLNEAQVDIKKMTHALTNAVYRVKVSPRDQPESRFLLRIYGSNTENLFSRETELAWFYRVGRAGYGPKLLAVFANGRLEEYLAHEPITVEDIRVASTSKDIARTIRRIHSLFLRSDSSKASPSTSTSMNNVSSSLSALQISSMTSLSSAYPSMDRNSQVSLSIPGSSSFAIQVTSPTLPIRNPQSCQTSPHMSRSASLLLDFEGMNASLEQMDNHLNLTKNVRAEECFTPERAPGMCRSLETLPIELKQPEIWTRLYDWFWKARNMAQTAVERDSTWTDRLSGMRLLKQDAFMNEGNAKTEEEEEDWHRGDFEQRKVDLYWVHEIENAKRALDQLNCPVVFSHNDTQYGNILRVQKAAANELMFVDYEYSSFNYRGFDLGNHLWEWTTNYQSDAEPHAMFAERYPSHAEERVFLEAYLSVEMESNDSGHDLNMLPPSEAAISQLQVEVHACGMLAQLLWMFWGVIQALEKTPGICSSTSPCFEYMQHAKARMYIYETFKHRFLNVGDTDDDSGDW